MKITLLILLIVLPLLSVLGMFYWMYKSKNGELELSKNDWHVKLLSYMWDFETWEAKNACPYYWGLVFSILIIIPYLIIRYTIKLCSYLQSKLPVINMPKLPVINFTKFNIDIIPKSKKEMYTKVYKNSKKWLINGFLLVLLLLCLSGAIYIFYKIFLESVNNFIIILSITALLSVHILFLLVENNFFINNYWNHLIKLGEGLIGILKFPILLIYEILKYPANYIFGIYTNNCPAITWTK